MFGIPVEGPTNVFCDNRGVVLNSSRPVSNFKKKNNSIKYHLVREAAAAGILRAVKEDGTTNLVDLLTKSHLFCLVKTLVNRSAKFVVPSSFTTLSIPAVAASLTT